MCIPAPTAQPVFASMKETEVNQIVVPLFCVIPLRKTNLRYQQKEKQGV